MSVLGLDLEFQVLVDVTGREHLGAVHRHVTAYSVSERNTCSCVDRVFRFTSQFTDCTVHELFHACVHRSVRSQ